MSVSGWAAVLLCCAAVLVGWPATGRSRWRALLGRTPGRAGSLGSGSVSNGSVASGSATGGPFSVAPRRGRLSRPVTWLSGGTHRLTALSSLAAGLAASTVAGPVAGAIAATYSGIAAHVALGQRAARVATRERRHRLDDLCAMAADLRAGLPPPPGAIPIPAGPRSGEDRSDRLGRSRRHDSMDRIDNLVRAAALLAERTGAPLADLLDRIEADARATDRGLAAADAQAAGARATAWLLAVLPTGGIALGYAIGVDPLEVLLHTPVGAGCAVAALLLQLGGLFWSNRLSTTAGQVP